MKNKASQKSFLSRFWYFIWHDNSIWSWLVNMALAFLIIKFIVYPGLGLLTGTSLPIVAVVSESMDHDYVADHCQPIYRLCDEVSPSRPDELPSFARYWDACGEWYEKRGIPGEEFADYSFAHGFSKGDIILLKGKEAKDIALGDVIVFQSKKPYPIIHRVVNKTATPGLIFFETKGDHNPTQITDFSLNERYIPANQVLGVAVMRIPYLGWLKIAAVELLSGGESCV